MKIDSKKLTKLHEYFINGGSTDEEDVAAQLDTEDSDVVVAYTAALRKKYPDVYGDGTEDEEPEEKFYLIEQDTGLTKDLELVREKKGKKFFSVVEPKDIVEIVVGGEPIEVDLISLRKRKPDDTVGGHRVSTLIVAAELAKG